MSKVIKSCTVISTFFGNRRSYPSGVNQTIEYLKGYLDFLIKLDSGVNSDIILANHQCLKELDPQKKSLKFLSELNGLKTANGQIKVIHRPWKNGTGLGFKTMNTAFEKFRNEYDYWFFVEDDVRISLPKYFKYCIQQLEDEKSYGTAYICGYSDSFGTGDGREDIPAGHGKHCHGSAGCTHIDFLEKVYKKYGSLPYCKMERPVGEIPERDPWYACQEASGEVAFSNAFIQEGYNLSLFNSEKYSENKPIIKNVDGLGE